MFEQSRSRARSTQTWQRGGVVPFPANVSKLQATSLWEAVNQFMIHYAWYSSITITWLASPEGLLSRFVPCLTCVCTNGEAPYWAKAAKCTPKRERDGQRSWLEVGDYPAKGERLLCLWCWCLGHVLVFGHDPAYLA